MTENLDRAPVGLPARGISFRVMRVESDFRRDTRNLGRREREEYSSFIWNMMRLERKPKVAILDVVGLTQDNPIDYHQERSLNASIDHYKRRDNRGELRQVLKYYCAYMMQHARKERDQGKQLFCVFKAVDFARMIVQFSPYAVNADAEALVFGIFHDLGTQLPNSFGGYMTHEQTIFNQMKRLQVAPLDNTLRSQLGETYSRQTSYFDALVQYQHLLTRFPVMPREADTNRGRVYIKIAELFQRLADHASENAEELGDARKLKNFIERYNRDFADRGQLLPTISGPSLAQVTRVAGSLREIASRWYLRSLAVRTIGPREVTRQVVRLAENQLSDQRPKEALKLLLDAYPYWRRVPDTIESLPERIYYLTLISNVAMQLRRRDRMDWANQEMREFQNRLSEIQNREDEQERRKEALRMGEELPS